MMDLSVFGERLGDLIFESEEKFADAKSFANAIGVEGSTITRFLRGERAPSVAMLIKIADYFHCSTDFLLGREEENSTLSFKSCPPFSERLEELLHSRDYSCYRFSEEAKIHQSLVYAWKIGKRIPTIDNVIKIAEFFDCRIDFVLGRE